MSLVILILAFVGISAANQVVITNQLANGNEVSLFSSDFSHAYAYGYDSAKGYSLYYNSPCDLGCFTCTGSNSMTCSQNGIYSGDVNQNLFSRNVFNYWMSELPDDLYYNIMTQSDITITEQQVCNGLDGYQLQPGELVCASWQKLMTSFWVYRMDQTVGGVDYFQVWMPYSNAGNINYNFKYTNPTPTSSHKYTPTPDCYYGYYGSGSGQGSAGDCCQSGNDCRQDCVNGRCDGTNASPPQISCRGGSSGLGNGDGVNGACCRTSNDCVDTCTDGMCNNGGGGTVSCSGGNPSGSTGDGGEGACCATSNDCINTCINGVCNRPDNNICRNNYYGAGSCCNTNNDCPDICSKGVCIATATSTTKTTTVRTTTKATTTKTATPTTAPCTCNGGYYGTGTGGGFTGACCRSSNDCMDTCNRDGICGLGGTTYACTNVTRSTNGCSCQSGFYGTNNGGGPTGACCQTSNDCQDTCNSNGMCGVSGVIATCNATTTTTSTTTSLIATPTSVTGCLSLSSLGLQLQDGVTGTCCLSDLDCVLEDMCIDGVCTSYYYDPEAYDDCTNCGSTCNPPYIYTTTVYQTATVTLGNGNTAPTPFAMPFPPAPPFCFLCFAGVGGSAGPGGVACYNDNDCGSNSCNSNICANVTSTATTTGIPIIIGNNSTTISSGSTASGVSSTTISSGNTASGVSSTTISSGGITSGISSTATVSGVSSTTASVTINATWTEYYTFTVYVNATSTTAAATPTSTTCSCITGYLGVGNGKGPTGACCKTSNDCVDTCNSNGICGVNGVPYTCSPTKTTPTPISTATATTCSCITGYSGVGNGKGPTGACCKTSNDCVDTCNSDGACGVSGVTYTCSTTIPCSCISGYLSTGTGKGPTGACCKTSSDCVDTCNSDGACGVSGTKYTC